MSMDEQQRMTDENDGSPPLKVRILEQSTNEKKEANDVETSPTAISTTSTVFISQLPIIDETDTAAIQKLRQELLDVLQAFGPLNSLELCKQKSMRGKAFAEFHSPEDAQRCCSYSLPSGDGDKDRVAAPGVGFFHLGESTKGASSRPFRVELKRNDTRRSQPKQIPVATASNSNNNSGGGTIAVQHPSKISSPSSSPLQPHASVEKEKASFAFTVFVQCKTLRNKYEFLQQVLPKEQEAPFPREQVVVGSIIFVEKSRKPYFLVEVRIRKSSSEATAEAVLDRWIDFVGGLSFNGERVTAARSKETVKDRKLKMEHVAMSSIQSAAAAASNSTSLSTTMGTGASMFVPRSVRVQQQPHDQES